MYRYTNGPEFNSPLAPSSAYALPETGRHPFLRVCQLVKVSRRVTLPLVYRRWLITSAGIRLPPILTSGGSLRFQSLKTLPHPRCPVKGAAEDR